jgi:hypothetical protein
MDTVELTAEEKAKLELQEQTRRLLANFTKEEGAKMSTLERLPIVILQRYQMRTERLLWNEAGKTDEFLLRKFMERLTLLTSRSESEEYFIRTCFQSISPETPVLTRMIGFALPALLWIVFDRYPEMHIFLRVEKDATPALVEAHKRWNALVLEMLEIHIKKGEDIPRKELIARRINDEEMHDAVNVLSGMYVRWKFQLKAEIAAIDNVMNEAVKKRQQKEITSEALNTMVEDSAAPRRKLQADLESLPAL